MKEGSPIMRSAIVGMMAGLVIVLALSDAGPQPNRSWAQLPDAVAADNVSAAGGLIALGSDVAQGRQQVTVIDPRTYVMSVYHIEHATGTISLKSVRNIQADLMMDEYNTDIPLPREVRAILTKQRP
jgi:hypothetical protein